MRLHRALASVLLALSTTLMTVLSVVPAHAEQEATGTVSITSVTVSCECGGFSRTSLYWGWGATSITYADLEPGRSSWDRDSDLPLYTYGIDVSPDPEDDVEAQSYYQPYVSDGGTQSTGLFAVGRDGLLLGTTYTFTVTKYLDGEPVAVSEPYEWTPAYGQHPDAMGFTSTKLSNGVHAFVAGRTYQLVFRGEWGPDHRVFPAVQLWKRSGTSSRSLVARTVDEDGAWKGDPNEGITFKVPAKAVGSYVFTGAYGQTTEGLPWGWMAPAEQWGIPVVASGEDRARYMLSGAEPGWVGVDAPAKPRVGARVRAVLHTSEENQQRYGFEATYRWQRVRWDDERSREVTERIAGATGRSYRLTREDVRKWGNVQVLVTFRATVHARRFLAHTVTVGTYY
ncbi:hypothetical protein [Nocardioides sp. GY 10127]|uniref:hypothetical protein n=1 Tax=Nocardioides sp. GY 10127 TaxID=2569762 RepID=UPI0010A8BDF3|nr:hypothetical protein [Nocardioides sp. GY 10127]TIC80737.1 hypothetical protein E8D37_12700 [Nocardioides sp. GY 10127]